MRKAGVRRLPLFSFVRLTGLEPARRETLDPKSSASTNSATGAFDMQKYEEKRK